MAEYHSIRLRLLRNHRDLFRLALSYKISRRGVVYITRDVIYNRGIRGAYSSFMTGKGKSMERKVSALFRTAVAAAVLVGLGMLCVEDASALVASDLEPCSGDRLVVLDTVSRREWLNLHGAYTPGYAELTGPENDCNPTCTKGQFSGWTLASEQDVMELLNNAGLSPYGAENRDAAYGFIV
ncbi:MAG: hypothetical protein MUC52_03485, partial [Candidatus Omnitrophica bacterium]|nr:hypothetical protein [Candidatus Omnitrophota bacterium]